MFAVFEAKGFQYLGSPGDKLRIPYVDTEVGKKVSFDRVLLVKNGDVKIGKPYIEGASIEAKVLEHGRYKKILVFKFKRRTRYKRTKGHRQTYTEIEIKDIVLGAKTKSKKKTEKEEVKKDVKKGAKAKTKKTTKTTKKTKSEKTTGKTAKTKAKKSTAKTTKKSTKSKPKKTTGKKKTTKSKTKKKTSKSSGKTGKKKTSKKSTKKEEGTKKKKK